MSDEERYNELLERHSNMLGVIYNPDKMNVLFSHAGDFDDFGPKWMEMLGMSARELIGHDVASLIYEPFRDWAMSLWNMDEAHYERGSGEFPVFYLAFKGKGQVFYVRFSHGLFVEQLNARFFIARQSNQKEFLCFIQEKAPNLFKSVYGTSIQG